MKERAIAPPAAIAPPGGRPHAGGPHIEIARRPKRVAILQSNYIPWKGYFDIINMVDEFIIYDDMQYTKNDWRNRNKVKSPTGPQWLTIPVEVSGKFGQTIREAVIGDRGWAPRHWKTICQNYARARHFRQYQEFFEGLYLGPLSRFLSEVNYTFIVAICGLLGITTRITWSSEYELVPGKTERVVGLCKQAAAGAYLSGPAARDYLDEAAFEREGIRLTYIDYACYLEYEQLFPPFEHGVSVVDLILNAGPDAPQYMKSFS